MRSTATVVDASAAWAIPRAASLLLQGQLVAFPTETVYGLGGDATNDAAVAAIFAAKDRPRFNPLIVHVADLSAAERVAVFDARARRLAEALWPGPLTLVLPRPGDSAVSQLVSAGLATVAVRVPRHPIAQALLTAAACPIAAPSANPAGRISPTTAAHVAESLGNKAAMIINGGPCRIGIESTVVDLTGAEPCLLRSGGTPNETISAIVGPLADAGEGQPRSPGMLRRHYAPKLPLRLGAVAAHSGEALLGFGPGASDATMNLSTDGDIEEAAANLFAMLHALDGGPYSGIAVMPIPDQGLGLAINDRLRRATAPADDDDPWSDNRGPSAPCVLPGIEDDAT